MQVSTAKKMATTESALKLMADLREKSFASAQVDLRRLINLCSRNCSVEAEQ